MKIFFKSLASCRTRAEQFQQYQAYALAAGHHAVDSPADAEAVLLWTCAFREDFKNSSLEKIEYYIQNTQAKIIIAGCLYDIDKESLPPTSDRISYVQWKNDATDLPAALGSVGDLENFRCLVAEEKICDNSAEHRRLNPDSKAIFVDQFNKLVISSGCLYNCSYCSEKLVFPAYRSHRPEALAQAAKALYQKNGVKQFCLIADSLGQYGVDLGWSLTRLIDYLRKTVAPFSFALHNFNLACFLKDWGNYVRLLQEGAFCHLNLPIQSASDHMLELMNREYRLTDLRRLYKTLNQHNFTAHDTHLLVGFPGEKDDDIEQTLDFLLEYRPRYILLSRFMPCVGSAAFLLPDQVSEETASKRITKITDTMKLLGVIVNSDNSELSHDRRRRLAHD